jgi:transcriptional regulator with XRE-family HTH domain
MEAHLKTRLRLWRVRHRLTLDEISDLTGYSTAMLSRAERGERCFSPLAKVHIARALDVRIADLFDVEHAPDREEVTANDAHPARGSRTTKRLEP